MCSEQDISETSDKCSASLLLLAGGNPSPGRHDKKLKRSKHLHFDCSVHGEHKLQANKVSISAQRLGCGSNPRSLATGVQASCADQKARLRPCCVLQIPLDVPTASPLLQDQIPARILQSAVWWHFRQRVCWLHQVLQQSGRKTSISLRWNALSNRRIAPHLWRRN